MLNFLAITSEAYNVRHTFSGYKRKVVDPIVRLLKKSSNSRAAIKAKIISTLIKQKQEIDMSTAKKKKLKDLKKAVGKLE